jgi:hypothetical protein
MKMKRIRLFAIISLVVPSVFSSVVLAQDLSAARPRPLKELQQQVPENLVESVVASDVKTRERESDSTVLARWVRLGKQEAPSVAEPNTAVYSPWIGNLKRNASSREHSTRIAFKSGAAANVAPRFAPLLLNAATPLRPAVAVEILSPQSNDKFALKRITVSVRFDSSIETLQLLITKKAKDSKDDEIVHDSGPIKVPGQTNLWEPQIELSVGTYTFEVKSRDKTGMRIDAVPVTGVTRVEARSAHDDRGTFEASFYLGYGIDSFAAADLRTYLNPEASGKVEERLVGGFDFSYRLYGDPMRSKGQQLWVYGETVHGVRSADLDCTKNPDQPLCKDLLNDSTPDPSGQLVAILRKATSLEAFAGFRWEFSAINNAMDSPARAYLKSQFGFVTVAGLGGDVVDLHQYVALGLTATKGKYRNSYVELGYGKSDFFLDNKKKRWKIDGFLSWGSAATEGIGTMLRPFAQITVDSDFGKGSDSVQTYIGIDFDLSVLWKRAQ